MSRQLMKIFPEHFSLPEIRNQEKFLFSSQILGTHKMTNFLLKREIRDQKNKEIQETPTDRRTNKKEIESKTDRRTNKKEIESKTDRRTNKKEIESKTDKQTDRQKGGGEREREREREIDLCFQFSWNLRTYFWE